VVAPPRGRASSWASLPRAAARSRGAAALSGGRACVFHNTFDPAAAGALTNCLGLGPVSEPDPRKFGKGGPKVLRNTRALRHEPRASAEQVRTGTLAGAGAGG
jgi:hypothetical protein